MHSGIKKKFLKELEEKHGQLILFNGVTKLNVTSYFFSKT